MRHVLNRYSKIAARFQQYSQQLDFKIFWQCCHIKIKNIENILSYHVVRGEKS